MTMKKNLRLELVERLDFVENGLTGSDMLIKAVYVETQDDELAGEMFERFNGFGTGLFLRRKTGGTEWLYWVHRPEVQTVQDAVKLYDDGGEIDDASQYYDNIVIDGVVWTGKDPFERYIPF